MYEHKEKLSHLQKWEAGKASRLAVFRDRKGGERKTAKGGNLPYTLMRKKE